MVKKIIILIFGAIFLCADPIDEVVMNLIGEHSYRVNQNFISRLFAKKDKFYFDEANETINYYEITKTLKDNGLLNLKLKNPQEVSLGFRAKTSPIFLMRTINGILSSIGYSYFTIAKAKYAQRDTYLTFTLNTEHGVAPEIVLSELKKQGILASKVVRTNQTDWFYELEILTPSIAGATPLGNDDRLELKNISGEYWFHVENAGTMSILKKNSRIGWSPRIVLYDKNLQVLQILTQKEFAVSMGVNIPSKTAFVMVTDLNNPARLKNGITVTFTAFGAE